MIFSLELPSTFSWKKKPKLPKKYKNFEQKITIYSTGTNQNVLTSVSSLLKINRNNFFLGKKNSNKNIVQGLRGGPTKFRVTV